MDSSGISHFLPSLPLDGLIIVLRYGAHTHSCIAHQEVNIFAYIHLVAMQEKLNTRGVVEVSRSTAIGIILDDEECFRDQQPILMLAKHALSTVLHPLGHVPIILEQI